jgi:hypothetical protein
MLCLIGGKEEFDTIACWIAEEYLSSSGCRDKLFTGELNRVGNECAAKPNAAVRLRHYWLTLFYFREIVSDQFPNNFPVLFAFTAIEFPMYAQINPTENIFVNCTGDG